MESTLDILADLVENEVPIFAMPSWFVTADSAQVGFLLGELTRELSGGPPGTTFRSFYANSRFEALHGAIKLMRHLGLARFPHHGGRVLALDPDGSLGRRGDPLRVGPERALVPGIAFCRSVDDLAAAADAGPYCGVVLRETHGIDVELAGRFRSAGARITVDLGDVDVRTPTVPALAALQPDLVVYGESLTGDEVPFGAFSGPQESFSPWSDPGTAFLHSNTYGGNSVAMRRVKETLGLRWDADAPVRRQLLGTEDDWDRVLDLYARHVNPATVRMHRQLHGALRVVQAQGSRLTVQLDSGRRLELIDGLCGAGLGINGHNPPDAVSDVVRKHDPDTDYVSRLEQVLAAETALPHLFPAVSGASAVETALTLAVLAQPDRPKILVFDHNYGGKTLVSLLATAAERTRAPFGPLYADIVHVDPFAADAPDQLRRQLAAGDVGLVWIELVHGSSDSYAPIPDELLQIVAEERARQGFLVGIDEILTSYYRCRRRFAHQGRLPEIDIMTLSKALSYGCFPVGAALVSDAVHAAAQAAHPELVEELRTEHANQLGAHFALHAVAQVDALGLPEHVPALDRIVSDGIAGLDPQSRSVGRRFAEGQLGRVEILPPRSLRRFLPVDGERLNRAAMAWWITQARAFVVYDVFLLPVHATEPEIRQVMAAADRLARTSPWVWLARVWLFRAAERLRRALPTTAIRRTS